MSGRLGPTLRVISGENRDLPPRWDGQPIGWTDWRPSLENSSSLRFHMDTRCECGSTRPEAYAYGYACDEPGERYHGGGGRILPPGKVIRFAASRCPECALDTVLDLETDVVWDLDALDYSDTGSYAR